MAVLSENVYTDGWKEATLTPTEQASSTTQLPDTTPEAYSKACTPIMQSPQEISCIKSNPLVPSKKLPLDAHAAPY